MPHPHYPYSTLLSVFHSASSSSRRHNFPWLPSPASSIPPFILLRNPPRDRVRFVRSLCYVIDVRQGPFSNLSPVPSSHSISPVKETEATFVKLYSRLFFCRAAIPCIVFPAVPHAKTRLASFAMEGKRSIAGSSNRFFVVGYRSG